MSAMKYVTTNNLLILMLFSLQVMILFGQEEPNNVYDCNEFVLEIWHCSDNVAETCEDWSEQDSLMCMERILSKKLKRCNDEIAIKSARFQVISVKSVQDVFCPNIVTTNITRQHRCLRAVKHISSYWSYLTPGFLSSKGCKFFRVYIISEAQLFFPPECSNLMRTYINILFNESSCGGKKVEVQNAEDCENLNKVYQHVDRCLTSYKIPECTPEKSELVKCVEKATLHQVNNPNLRAMKANILDVAKTQDKVICANPNLKKSLQSNRACLDMLWPMDWYFIEQINGFFTEEGCKGLKYVDHVKCKQLEKAGCHVIHDYVTAMKSNLTCAKLSSETTYKSLIVVTLAVVIIATYVYIFYY